MRYAAIAAQKAHFPVEMMCELLDVSPSGYYAWQKRPESRRAQRDRALSARIGVIHAESRRTYGSPRIAAELRASGEPVARKRVARLMREQGIAARRKRRFVQTTNSAHHWPIASNVLARQFTVAEPNSIWAADITYIATAQGWLYLAVVLDLATRGVVGWAMGESLATSLALEALEMAVFRRGPPKLHHSDRGTQYASDSYQLALQTHGIRSSMSRTGDCWDNAVVESFFSTLKTECVRDQIYVTRAAARTAIFDYIEAFYNRRRRHSSLGYRSPAEYEREVLRGA